MVSSSRSSPASEEKRYTNGSGAPSVPSAEPFGSSSRASSLRRSILQSANASVSARFMDSFRAAVLLEDVDGDTTVEKVDELGVAITKALNASPDFHGPLHLQPDIDAASFRPMDEVDTFSMQPLLSTRNLRIMRSTLRSLFEAMTHKPIRRAMKVSLNVKRYLLYNAKSPWIVIPVFVAWMFVALTTCATAFSMASVWLIRFLWLLFAFLISILIDTKELIDLLPQRLTRAVVRVANCIRWIDSLVLFGRRYQGREWNKDEFHFQNANQSQSFRAKSLLEMPMPLKTEDGDRSQQRAGWGEDTCKHVAAIDFAHTMVKQAVLRKHLSKKKKKALQRRAKTEGTPILSVNDTSGETVTYTRTARQSDRAKPVSTAKMTKEPASDTVDLQTVSPTSTIDLSISESPRDQFTKLPTRTPKDAIEVQNRKKFAFEENDDPALSNEQNQSTDSVDDVIRLHHSDDMLHDSDEDSEAETDTTNSSGCGLSLESGSDLTTDMNWSDVGAQIGIKILGSAAVQKAMASQDTVERITNIKDKVESSLVLKKALYGNESSDDGTSDGSPVSVSLQPSARRPVHPMWTSAAAAAQSVSPLAKSGPENAEFSNKSFDDIGEISENGSQTDLPVDQSSGGANGASKPPETNQQRSKKKKRWPFKPKHRPAVQPKSVEDEPKPSSKRSACRPLLQPGVKIVVPMCPIQPDTRLSGRRPLSNLQMGTVVASKRISLYARKQSTQGSRLDTNCLTLTVKLDRSFLRNGEFAELSCRIMDEWPDRYMPKHSKLPLGSCVSTVYGLGVLVGWRVEDDCHIIRSLWQRRGPGSACAYLQRDAIHATVPSAIGFDVETPLGDGTVVSFVGGSTDYNAGSYYVRMKAEGRYNDQVLELNKTDVLACRAAKFVPAVEHIREAAQYQLQVDAYKESLKKGNANDPFDAIDGKVWARISEYTDVLWRSFLRAIEQDDEFDEGMNVFISSIVSFFNNLDSPSGMIDGKDDFLDGHVVITATESTQSSKHQQMKPEGVWFMNDMFGIFGSGNDKDDKREDGVDESIEVHCIVDDESSKSYHRSYDRAFAVIKTLMRTVSLARAESSDDPEFKLGLTICHEVLLFVRTVVKVQQRNVSPRSLKVWRAAWAEIVSTFGPAKDRLKRICQGIAERMERQGRKAKVRLLRFVDIVVQDDILLMGLENADWDRCAEQIEEALVQSKIIEQESREHYRKTVQFGYNHFSRISARNESVTARNNAKLAKLMTTVQWLAKPRKSLLRLLLNDHILDTLERILVHVFKDEDVASRMLSIHASNFHSLRQLRLLKDFTIAGKLWMPLLDAANAEMTTKVTALPDNAKELLLPISTLFSLCVARFHKLSEGDLTTDWLNFLLEEEAVEIIHEIDMKLILALESFSRDVQEMMVILPYYASIEDDILKLVDEVDIQEFVREASEAMEDPDKLAAFIREKTTIAIERFLDYLPKMSIPVEKRDLNDGWVLTCRSEDGGDLMLTDLTIKRENLTCQVMGGDTLFFPMLGTDEDVEDCTSEVSTQEQLKRPQGRVTQLHEESSVLDYIRDMLIEANNQGCWRVGIGGIESPPKDRYIASALHNMPVSSVLDCGIELWRNLEIDDDELLEIAIRDVSYQIRLHKEREESGGSEPGLTSQAVISSSRLTVSKETKTNMHRFNPRVDPTVIYLEIQKLTFNLDNFRFRIEKNESKRTVFDPVFEGSGSLMVQNVSIKLRVECAKSHVRDSGRDVAVPILQLRELNVKLERVRLKVKDTGADWLLNKVVKQFEDNITTIVSTNLNDQIREQVETGLQKLNSYTEVNPSLMLEILGIDIHDLEDKVVWV